MNYHPILFSTEMVEAIISGRKTQTRRVFKDHPSLSSDISKVDLKKWMGAHPDYIYSFCPYGKPGDILWVRETWKSVGFDDDIMPQLHIQYKDGVSRWVDVDVEVKLKAENKWKPSIHMIKAAARIWLRVKRVDVDRLQNISENDAISEGIFEGEKSPTFRRFKNYYNKPCRFFNGREKSFWNPVTSFFSLWCSINGRESLESNPWVWVVEFEVISTNDQLNRKELKSWPPTTN
jgi:hypothetical protein